MAAPTRHPFIKFYGRDWLGDADLGRCSLEAQGLWISMIALMMQSPRHGHLCGANGKPLSADLLAFTCRTPETRVRALLAELETAGVFSRDPKGVIFSRRMVRDFAQAEQGRKAVEKRWGASKKPRLVAGTDVVKPQKSKVAQGVDPTTPPSREGSSPPTTYSHRHSHSQNQTLPPTPQKPAALTPSQPRVSEAKAWRDLPVERPPGARYPETDRPKPGVPRWEAEMVAYDRGGQYCCNGFVWDDVQGYVREALGWSETKRVDWEPLAHWLWAGWTVEEIEERLIAARQRREASGQDGISSLKFFASTMADGPPRRRRAY